MEYAVSARAAANIQKANSYQFRSVPLSSFGDAPCQSETRLVEGGKIEPRMDANERE
jgi:hypothetical protein